jgi:hypothetical protein
MRVIFVKWITILRCLESFEESLEQLLASGLLLGFGVIVLALQGGPELDGRLEMGAGLAD